MFWLLVVLIYGADPGEIAVGTKLYPTAQACADKVTELKASPLPAGAVAGEAACEQHSDPATEKDATVTP